MRGSFIARLGLVPVITAIVLVGCGSTPSKAVSSTPPSKSSQPPVTVTVTDSVPIKQTTTIQPSSPSAALSSNGAFNPNAPTNLSSPVPLSIQGSTGAAAGVSSITVGYSQAAYYQWNLFSLTLWVFGNPPGSYTQSYWTMNNNGTYTLGLPMALARTSVRVIAQFLGPQGQIVAEYGPTFTVR